MKYIAFFLICFTALLQVQDTHTADFKGPCPDLELLHGRVRLRSKGRIARFKCIKNYQLVGSKLATCIRGSWDTAVPICIQPDCPKLANPGGGHWVSKYRGAVVTLICDTGYTLNGTRTIYCIDKQWNHDVPVCQVSDTEPKTSCDFESEDICGWTHDPYHNFDWSRHNYATPSGHVGTGPSFDHTLGQGFDGHYMYIESSSPRFENDTARLNSPLYRPELSQNACFVFWYHMYGATTGTLKVHLKVPNDDGNMKTVFQKSGEQGNRWYVAVINLDPVDQPFQVVVEAIRGRSYVSDIAIDDVKLTDNEECQNITMETTVPPTPQKSKSLAPEPALPMKGVAVIIAGVAVIAIIAAVTIFIVTRRRMAFRRRNDMAEDSDVRFLTSDEVLDFNLARPMEDDL